MKEFESINKKVYGNLELILQKLDERIDLKMYAAVFDADEKCTEIVRVKSVLSNKEGTETEIIQEVLEHPADIFMKLGLTLNKKAKDEQFLFNLDMTQLTELREKNQIQETAEQASSVDNGSKQNPAGQPKVNENALFYTNKFLFEKNNLQYTLKYVASLEYEDFTTRDIFINRPQLSFLRMILDYYFIDYYKASSNDHVLQLDHGLEITSKYREEDSQYLQRMTRLFFGKVQHLVMNADTLTSASQPIIDIKETERNQYYINNLLEKIDGISTRTYEGESPFGCMLILNTDLLKDDSLIRYSIKFQEGSPIQLEDARRIRKLIELTNNEKDLYLIADNKAIYGVGEIHWNKLGDILLFKVEFKGLSRYDLLLVTTGDEEHSDYRVVEETESKIFKMTVDRKIVSSNLLSISFKSPAIGSGGFVSELFRLTMKKHFKELTAVEENDKGLPGITEDNIEKLRLIIQKATEQQHGTMVVITDPETAKDELDKLEKQSTRITRTEINPAFIKHLTSIDGAIYFDTDGNCHAIGVILDGLAQAHSGNASRGARFHSAHRYLEKLKSNHSRCVIAIISEDGMVNIIPSQTNGAAVRQLVRDMRDYIMANDTPDNKTLINYKQRFTEAEEDTIIDHHHFFVIAEAFQSKSLYDLAEEYYKKGLQVYGGFIYKYNRELGISMLKQLWKNKKDNQLEFAKETLEQFENIIRNGGDDLIHDDYNCRALASHQVGILMNNIQAGYFDNALRDYSTAMTMQKGNKYILYFNRADLHISMKNWYLAIEDYISSELEKSNDRSLNDLKRLFDKDHLYFKHAFTFYSERENKKKDSKKLKSLLDEYGKKLAVDYPEVAAAIEKQTINPTITEGE